MALYGVLGTLWDGAVMIRCRPEQQTPKGGRLPPMQTTAHALLRESGATIDTAVGIDAAIRQLKMWGLLKGCADVRDKE